MIIKRTIFYCFILGLALIQASAANADPDRVDADSALPAAQVSIAVKLAKIQQKSVGENLFSYGTLIADPNHLLSLSLSKPGLISRLWVRAGQRVRRGERLVEVVTAPEAHQQFLQAQTAVDFATRDLKRKIAMRAGRLATQAEVDRAAKELRDAKSGLNALRQLGVDRKREILTAPVDGIITQLEVARGQRVPANTIALKIATAARLVARLGIEPENLARIKPGLPVTITSVFGFGIRVNSRIREIHAAIDPRTHLVEILVPIPGGLGEKLILGSRLNGYIHLPQHRALMVPRSAVLSGRNGSYLFKAQGGTAHYVAVKTGLVTGNMIEVTGNIKKGERIIVLGNYELSDGMAIREER